MAQPADFIGLNTFIYEPSVYDTTDLSYTETAPTYGYKYILDEQNLTGTGFVVGVQQYPYDFKLLIANNSHQFGQTIPDPQTGLAPITPAGILRASASMFPVLMLHRNGPYGWPTWKQIRTSDTHLIRKQKKHSIFTYVEEPGKTTQYEIPGVGTLTNTDAYSEIKVYKESAVVSKYKPVILNAGKAVDFSDSLLIYAPLGNETVYFDNYRPNRFFAVSEEESKFYTNIKKLYLYGNLQRPDSDIKSFHALIYNESVYPALTNAYMSHVRSRTTFDFPWRKDIRARMAPGTSETGDPFYAFFYSPLIDNGFGFNVYFQNRWSLDAAWNQDSFAPTQDGKYLLDGSTGQGALSYDDYMRLADTRKSIDSSSVFFFPIGGDRSFGEAPTAPYSRNTDSDIRICAGGDGQLMNTYSLFADWRQVTNSSGWASSVDEFLSASAFYSRRHVTPSIKSIVHFAGMQIPETASYEDQDKLLSIEESFGGSTKWQANTTRYIQSADSSTSRVYETKDPFENSYADFAEYIRLVGKDYSIVPEFRISNHVETYYTMGEIDGNDFGIFDISGALEGTSSSELNDDFYKIYSNSDFMKHFELVRNDHSGFVNPAYIRLKCNAIKKFTPYEGFYPHQRSLQVAKQFYKSYGDHFQNLESAVYQAENPDELIGSPSTIQVRLLGQWLHSYYDPDLYDPGQTQYLYPYYRGTGTDNRSMTNRGKLAPISTLDQSIKNIYLNPAACELGSSVWNTSDHPGSDPADLTFGMDPWIRHVDKNLGNAPDYYEDAFGFLLQDFNRNCVYIQLIDQKIWDALPADHFYNDIKRNYMFPVCDLSAGIQGVGRPWQPLLIADFSTTSGYPIWRPDGDWRGPIQTATGDTSLDAPIAVPVIWVKAIHDTDGVTSTAQNIVDAINDLYNDALSVDIANSLGVNPGWGPTRNLLHYFNRKTSTFVHPWGYYDHSQGSTSTTFPVSNSEFSLSASMTTINTEVFGVDEWDTPVLEVYDMTLQERPTDTRLSFNWCQGVSLSDVEYDETVMKSASGIPKAEGKFTKYNGNMINATPYIQSSTDDDFLYTKVQPFVQPLFAPGVLYNTIKSGVACDYALMTENINRVLASVSSSEGGAFTTASFWMIGSRTSQTGAFIGSPSADYFGLNGSDKWEALKQATESSTTDGFLSGAFFSHYGIESDTGLVVTPSGEDPHPSVGWVVTSSLLPEINGCPHNSLGVLALKENNSTTEAGNLFRGFDLRIPFEALVEPENYLAHRALVNQEPDNFLYFNKYLRLNYKAYWDGQGDNIYKKMIHNFLAEIPDFFLENGELQSFKSLRQGDPNFGLVESIPGGDLFGPYIDPTKPASEQPKRYNMRVKMFRSVTGSSQTLLSNGVHVTPPQDYDPDGVGSLRETITMYSRPSAFGPPSWDGYTEVTGNLDLDGNDNRNGYNYPFTPPYYHGEAWADITFIPTKTGRHTLDEILAASEVKYYRYWHPKANLSMLYRGTWADDDFNWVNWTGSLARNDQSKGDQNTYVASTLESYTYYSDGNWYGPQHPLFVNDNAMQLSASLNLFGKEEASEPSETEYDPVTNQPVVDQNFSKWSIQTKMETPVLNFNHISSSGTHQVVEIDFADYINVYLQNGLTTEGTVAHPTEAYLDSTYGWLGSTTGQYFTNNYPNNAHDVGQNDIVVFQNGVPVPVELPYQDRRITIFNGAQEYNFWFYGSVLKSGVTFCRPAQFINLEVCFPFLSNTTTRQLWFVAIDPATEGYQNTVKVDIEGLLTDQAVKFAFKAAIENNTPFTVTDPNPTGTKLQITCSHEGPAAEPKYSPDLDVNPNLIDLEVVTLGTYAADSLHLDGHSPALTTRGMWHQYGVIPDENHGVFMEITDLPHSWNQGALGLGSIGQSLTGSLADLVGFEKQKKKLGRLATSKQVREAVIAVPFIVENAERKFFEIPRADIDNALSDETPKVCGQSVLNMVTKMQRYVLPFQFDFIARPGLTPFAMYIFEFEHTFSKQDLCDMWQGLPPKIGTNRNFQTGSAAIAHPLLEKELLGGGTPVGEETIPASDNYRKGLPFNSRVRWMVFKAKQKAKRNYYDKLVKKPSTAVQDAPGSPLDHQLGYNWPYDFFSLVELVKIDATVMFTNITIPEGESTPAVETQTSSSTTATSSFAAQLQHTPSPEEMMNYANYSSGFTMGDDEELI